MRTSRNGRLVQLPLRVEKNEIDGILLRRLLRRLATDIECSLALKSGTKLTGRDRKWKKWQPVELSDIPSTDRKGR